MQTATLTKDTSGLTSDQQRAEERIMSLLNSGERYVGLTGSAGTGKTYLASHLIDSITSSGKVVHACAPTHKAAWVLQEKLKGKKVGVSTAHSFLCIIRLRDNDGDYYYTRRDDADTPSEGVVFLDESSMVGRSSLWQYIQDPQLQRLQWVFIGDPAQLPPVKEKPSPALEAPGAHLKDIVRQAKGNPIINLATAAREGGRYLTSARYDEETGQGVVLTRNGETFMQSALRNFSLESGEPPASRLLAYRNDRVDGYNNRVRMKLHGSSSLPRFVPGDWLMMRASFSDPVTTEPDVVAKNSEEVQILKVLREKTYCSKARWNMYELTVRKTNGQTVILPILHEDERRRYQEHLRKLAASARKGNGKWPTYYRLKERFAHVSYAYAMTIHKSQGSTFETAFVDHRDIASAPGPASIKRSLIYVAATRPSKRLVLLI